MKAVSKQDDELSTCDDQIDTALMQKQLYRIITDGSASFDERERQVVTWRYLSSQKTQQEIGQHFGVSRQHICDIEKAAIAKVKSILPATKPAYKAV